MMKKSLLATLLIAASLPAWSFDIRPGLWEVKRVESSHPTISEPGTYYVECIPQEEIDDPEGTFRNDLNEIGYYDVEYTKTGNTVTVTGTNTSFETDVSMKLLMTIYNNEHTRSVNEMVGTETVSITQEASWVKENC